MSTLREKLMEKMNEKGISAHQLELQSGLKRSAVQNILHGRSRKPSAEILNAISRTLGCSINDLLEEANNRWMPLKGNHHALAETPLQMDLYKEAVQVATEITKTMGVVPPKQRVLSYIEEIYQYSIEMKLTSIDTRFAKWLANRFWSNKS